MTSDVSALIVARPGRARDSLYALLGAVSQIEMIDRVDNGVSALKLVAEREPSLVLLDTGLGEDQAWSVLEQIKAARSQTRCIVLAGSFQQPQRARAAGADDVLLRGFRVAELYKVIEKLISGQQVGSESLH
jgi:DNA-binding NarL/FixJ family response regulator